MRVINLDVLKRDYCEDTCGERKCIDAMDKCMFMEFIDDQLIIEHNEWIPCNERLPSREEYQKCNGLFIVSDGNRTYSTYFDIYDSLRFGEPTIERFRIDKCVIAWMSLPEPYKEETK